MFFLTCDIMTCCTSLTAQQERLSRIFQVVWRAFLSQGTVMDWPRRLMGILEQDHKIRVCCQRTAILKKMSFSTSWAQRQQNYCECRDEMFLVLTCPFKWLMYAEKLSVPCMLACQKDPSIEADWEVEGKEMPVAFQWPDINPRLQSQMAMTSFQQT